MTDMTDTTTSITSGAHAQVITPYLCVHDAAGALAWYGEAFGAFEQMRVTGDDGRIGHSEFTIGGARFMMADEYPEIGVLSPRTLNGSAITLYLDVADVDYAYDRAVGAGAQGLQAPADQTHGNRTATITDPFGHRWMLSQHIEQLDVEEYAKRETGFTVTTTRAPVEPGYLTMHSANSARAMQFFSALFGWSVQPGSAGEGYGHVANTKFPMGFAPPASAGPVTVYFRVDDIDAYATKIVELGGQVLTRNQYESGGNAECVDDQGFRFDLFQPAPGY